LMRFRPSSVRQAAMRNPMAMQPRDLVGKLGSDMQTSGIPARSESRQTDLSV
jgi:hypothetical protein